MADTTKTLIVTKMKNEGPFIFEWLAYHLSIGIKDYLVYSNDCTDGTEEILQALAKRGYIQHRENPFRKLGKSLHQAVYLTSRTEKIYKKADWVATIDVDEFINIHVGDGSIDALYGAVPDANAISVTWRLFGNGHKHDFEDGFIIDQFKHCAKRFCPRPMKAWCFKTIFKNNGIFGRLDTHRPKQIKEERLKDIHWVNGSGRRLPLVPKFLKDQRRSTENTIGYDLVTINHYAVRSAESFIVKSDRGDAIETLNIGENYWFNLNHNNEMDHSIMLRREGMVKVFEELMADPELKALHQKAVAAHRAQIDALKPKEPFASLFKKITSRKLEKLSTMHGQFAQSVYKPEGFAKIPDELVDMDIPHDHVFIAGPSEHFPNPLAKLFQLDPFYEPGKHDHWR